MKSNILSLEQFLLFFQCALMSTLHFESHENSMKWWGRYQYPHVVDKQKLSFTNEAPSWSWKNIASNSLFSLANPYSS